MKPEHLKSAGLIEGEVGDSRGSVHAILWGKDPVDECIPVVVTKEDLPVLKAIVERGGGQVEVFQVQPKYQEAVTLELLRRVMFM